MEKRDVAAKCGEWITDARASVEGSVRVPLEGGVTRVIEIWASGEITSAHPDDGAIAIDGILRLETLYIDGSGELRAFDSDTTFSHTVRAEGAKNGMEAFGELYVESVSHKLTGDVIDIKADLCFLLSVEANEAYAIAAPSPQEEIEIKPASAEVCLLRAAHTAKAYVKADSRVPQSMPTAKEILVCRGYAVVKKLTVEADRAIVEGELNISAVYLSADKNAPLQHFTDTLPFGEIVKLTGAMEGDMVSATASVERIAMEQSADDSDALSVLAVVSLTARAYGHEVCSYIEDAYSTTTQLTLRRENIATSAPEPCEPQKRVVRLSATVDEGLPEVSRALYARPDVEILSVQRDGDTHCRVTGAVRLLMCYTSQDAGIRSMTLEEPFETDISVPQGSGRLFARAFGEYASVEGSGRELEIKCCLDICAFALKGASLSPVCAVEPGEPLEKSRSAIIVSFAEGGETAWDVARGLGVPPGSVFGQGDAPDAPFSKGERVFAIRK